jgi:biopolymer transport protein ExbB
MDWFGHAAITLLAIMLVNAAVILGDRLYRYSEARRQSRVFVRDAAAALRDVRWNESMAVAAKSSGSHVASVVAAGLTRFASAPPQFTDVEAVEAADCAFQRSRRMFAADLRHGLGTLSTIAGSAPFIRLLGTVFGIMNAFRGTGIEKSTALRMVAAYTGEAVVTTAMGLIVAIPAVWFHNYLRSRMEVFESEMSNAALEALTHIKAHPEWRNPPADLAVRVSSLDLDIQQSPVPRSWDSWEAPYDHQRALLLAMAYCALYTAFILVDATFRSYWWQVPYVDPVVAHIKREYVGGQELFSPDRRYLAAVPVIYREEKESSGDARISRWVCPSGSVVALRIVPNDRPLDWKPYVCSGETRYALESTDALLTWSCSVPVITWRTNGELLIQCSDCSSENLQQVKLDSFHRKITVLGSDGKPIDPQLVHPQPECVSNSSRESNAVTTKEGSSSWQQELMNARNLCILNSDRVFSNHKWNEATILDRNGTALAEGKRLFIEVPAPLDARILCCGARELFQASQPVDDRAFEEYAVIRPAMVGCNVDCLHILISLGHNRFHQRIGYWGKAVLGREHQERDLA